MRPASRRTTRTNRKFWWDWPTGFDVVAGIFFQFADPTQRSRIFQGLRDALNPGGLLLIQGYRPEQIGYATGGPTSSDDDASLAYFNSRFAQQGYRLPDLMRTIALSAAFSEVRNPPAPVKTASASSDATNTK